MEKDQAEIEAPPSQGGRTQTDNSLSIERAKTDESLPGGREDLERQTDQSMAQSRANADETRAHYRRSNSDAESFGSDERIQQERKTSDKALNKERLATDAARDRERKLHKTAEQKLLSTERKKTDRDLQRERRETDSELKKVQNDLKQEVSAHNSTLSSLTTRDEFMAIVSHDLRNPIGSISAATELLTETTFYAAADDDARDYIDMIARNANEALRLIGDLMDMEQIAIGELGIELEMCDMSDLISHAAKSFAAQCLAKGVDFRISQNDSIAVLCDRSRISQVLSNLVGNALKFTPAGGNISLMLRHAEGELQVSVTDTGPGIPAEMRKVVFERFWQLGKRDRRGLGLGLYISAMIVEAHKGRIWVDSEVGSGSTFYFSLPT